MDARPPLPPHGLPRALSTGIPPVGRPPVDGSLRAAFDGFCGVHFFTSGAPWGDLSTGKGTIKKMMNAPLCAHFELVAVGVSKGRALQIKMVRRLDEIAESLAKLPALDTEKLRKAGLQSIKWFTQLRHFRDLVTEMNKVIAACGGEEGINAMNLGNYVPLHLKFKVITIQLEGIARENYLEELCQFST